MRLRDLFSPNPAKALAVQTARRAGGAYDGWLGFSPLAPPDAALLDALREAVPVIDAAVDKIVRLTGCCDMECSNSRLQPALEEFMRSVKVGAASNGLAMFTESYLRSLLCYGNAVGEIVPGPGGRDIYALYNANLRALHIRPGKTPLEAEICVVQGGSPRPAPYPQLILHSALNPAPGELAGTPLLRGLPFVAGILVKIFDCVGVNFSRLGNLRYAVTYRPGDDRVDKAGAREIAQSISREWSEAMSDASTVKDFVAVGDVDIKVIGADSQMLDTQTPVRQLLEQITAKLGIPPFMLGLHWSTTERMSAQQADILTSELESYRRLLEPALTRICNCWLMLRGHGATARPVWRDINLQDEAEAARIRLLDAQARAIGS